jgi:hypothetical protein
MIGVFIILNVASIKILVLLGCYAVQSLCTGTDVSEETALHPRSLKFDSQVFVLNSSQVHEIKRNKVNFRI